MRATGWAAGAAVAVVVMTAGLAPAPAYADEVRDAQWHLDALGAAEAYSHSVGAGVTVAVLDSGVDASHPDLRASVRPGVDLLDPTADGRVDPAGAGTALAGLIAGHGHGPAAPPPGSGPGAAPALPADGVLGVAPAATILPVVVTGPGADPAPGTLAAGIEAAVAAGAGVICIGRTVPDDPAVLEALEAAVVSGVMVVVPGVPAGDAVDRFGGDGLLGAVPADRAGAGPAAQAPGLVAVPAAGVTSTGTDGGYYRYGRTGEAAASGVLAGVAALVRAAHPDLPAPGVAERIAGAAAAGTVDLVAALTPVAVPPPGPPTAAPTTPPPPQPTLPAPVTGGEPEPWVAAFDSDDWRRWLVAVPLVVFLLVLAAVSVSHARRVRR